MILGIRYDGGMEGQDTTQARDKTSPYLRATITPLEKKNRTAFRGLEAHPVRSKESPATELYQRRDPVSHLRIYGAFFVNTT